MDKVAGLDRGTLERARLSRDPRFDGKFIVAVKSTGIYCRPICPARTSKASNVRYYATAAAAAAAGYRPCLRCRPEAAPGTPAWLGTSALVRRALRLIGDGFLDDASVASLAASVGVGPRHLHRLFLQHVGASPVALAQTRRLQFAKRLLDETDLPIMDVAGAAGFGSLRRFNDAVRSVYGRPPRELRRARRGAPTTEAGEVVLRLAFRPPYDWPHLLAFLGRRAIPGVEQVDEHGYARTIATARGPAVVRVRRRAGEHALELRVCGATPDALFQISCTARRVFDLAADPERIRLALRKDPLLGPLLEARPGLRIPGVWEPFECAVRAVLGQQVSVAAARTFATRLVARAGRRVATGADGLSHLFPSAREIAAADLGGLGLTGARVAALYALARRALADGGDFAGPAEDTATAIASVPGCGAWTGQYVALRGLGDPDAFPASDLVLRRAAGRNGHPLPAAALESRAEQWRPWRGYAALHLWRAAAGPQRAGRATR